jgi:hypothetical protein
MRKEGGSLIKIITALLLLANPLYASKIPTGYNSWCFSEDPSKHAIEFGGDPANYWNGNKWVANDPSYEPCLDGFRSIKNRHFVFVDSINDVVRFAISDRNGNVHILKTKIGPLFLLNQSTSDTIFLAPPDLSGYKLLKDKIEIPNVYPGITCYIWNRKTGVDQQFVFSPGSDALIDQIWHDSGSDTACFTINSIELLVDSLNLEPRDNDGPWGFRCSRKISGDIGLWTEAGIDLFTIPQGSLEQGDLHAPLYRRIQCAGPRIWLCEGFRNSDIAAWPRRGYRHNDSRTWLTSGADTYISASSQGTSYYNSASLTVYRDTTLGVRERSLVWFESLADSIKKWPSIDSALLQVHYAGNVIGEGRLRLCRGIADDIWYKSAHATWNASYKSGNDSTKWAGGWGVHTSSFTTTNSVVLDLSDTSSAGWYQFSCKNLIEDVKADGADWGFWFDNNAGPTSQRTSFDSAENPTWAPRLYLEFRLGDTRSRKLKMEE